MFLPTELERGTKALRFDMYYKMTVIATTTQFFGIWTRATPKPFFGQPNGRFGVGVGSGFKQADEPLRSLLFGRVATQRRSIL